MCWLFREDEKGCREAGVGGLEEWGLSTPHLQAAVHANKRESPEGGGHWGSPGGWVGGGGGGLGGWGGGGLSKPH
mgnify:FL=1